MEVRLADESKRYQAKIKQIDYDCDLAIIDLIDEQDKQEFYDKTIPLKLGEMPNMRDRVYACGFPVGGEELCIIGANISRIECGEYVLAETELLQVQVSTAINSGNSGGPVLHKGKVVGVAFQGLRLAEATGYIIPIPVIEHFLVDHFKPGIYQGFPDLEIRIQILENPIIKQFYGIKKDFGIRVLEIAPLSTAKNILQEDDIILSIDNVPIKNDGTIKTSFSTRTSWNYLIHQKQIGEKITVDFLRNKIKHTAEICLQHKAYTCTLSNPWEFNKMPTYYIVNGFVLVPLTKNLLELEHDADIAKIGYKYKKFPGEEAVILSNIISTEHSRGYKEYCGEQIIKINGIVIKNLRDAIVAINNNSGLYHSMITHRKHQLILANLPEEKQQKILSVAKINTKCSTDLLKQAQAKPGFPEFYKTKNNLQSLLKAQALNNAVTHEVEAIAAEDIIAPKSIKNIKLT